MTILNVPIQLRRGNEVDCPTHMLAGEVYVCLDSGKIFAGTGPSTSLKQLGGSAAVWGAITGTLSSQTDLQAALTALTASITSEATTRATADTTEATARATADSTEATSRAAADTTLQSNITAEASTRATADGLLVPKTTTVAGHALSANVTLAESDITNLTSDLALKAPIASPALTGVPTAPTAAAATNNTQIATTAFVESEIPLRSAVTSVAGKTGAVTLAESDVASLVSDLAAKEATANKDAASGYAGLDASSLLKLAEFPNFMAALFPYMKNLAIDTVIEPQQVSSTGDGVGINYTVPTGKRAFVQLFVFNPVNLVADSVFLEIKFGGSGSWIQLDSATSSGVRTTTNPTLMGTGAVLSATSFPIFEAGDLIALNSTTGAAYFFGAIWTFDNTSPLKNPRIVGPFTTEGNTIYTCPNGKKAIHCCVGANDVTPSAHFFNNSGGIMNRRFYRVPNAASRTVNNQMSPGGGTTASAQANSVAPSILQVPVGALAAGDTVQLELVTPSVFTLTSVANASGGSTVYTGTFTGGAANAFAGASFTIKGFRTAGNNVVNVICTASTATTITLTSSTGVAETLAAFATVSTFTLSAVANASAGSTVYTGVFPIAASSAYIGHSVVIAGFGTSANNGTFTISASTTTSITVNNASGVAETHAGTAAWNGIATLVAAWLQHILEF